MRMKKITSSKTGIGPIWILLQKKEKENLNVKSIIFIFNY
jgi:hypothetical protein